MQRPLSPSELPLAEPLSQREREILALLAENRSNQEIANQLHLALSTVKWYLRQMFAKLGVNERRAAVAHGRSLGLLSDDRAPTIPNNLPAPGTPFVGREAEIETITQLLTGAEARLVTLLGPGGSGKTRLALQVGAVLAGKLHAAFRDGIWFVPLAALQDPQAIVQAIAGAAGVVFFDPKRETGQQLRDYFRRRQALLILDNFEHLLGAPSMLLVSELLHQAPGLRILVTTRARLNVQGESLLHVEGLSTPPIGQRAGADLAGFSALDLFAQCARRLRPGFEPDPESLAAIVRICQAVQGLPLGIELAAAWLEVLAPPAILAEIQKSFDFLRADWADAPERHHSLRGVFDASWKLLAPAERAALMTLTVFHGSFSPEAAERVSGATPVTLRALAHKSWLARQPDGRLQIHELLRHYAHEKLRADRRAWETAQDAHAGYFAELLQALGEQMKGPRQLEAFEQVALEFENARAAWQWLAGQGQIGPLVEHMLPALTLYCAPRWRGNELRGLVRQAQQVLASKPGWAPADAHLASLATAELLFYLDDGLVTTSLLTYRFQKLHNLPEDKVRFAWTTLANQPVTGLTGYWRIMATVLYGWRVEIQAALRALWDLRDHLQQPDQRWLLGLTNQHLGSLLAEHPALVSAARFSAQASSVGGLPRVVTASQVLREAIDLFQALGDKLEQARASVGLGEIQAGDDLEAAATRVEAAQQMYEAAGSPNAAAFLHLQLAFIYFGQGRAADGFRSLQTLRGIYETAGNRLFVAYALSWESIQAVRYGDLRRARAAREATLPILQASGDDTHSYAWAVWELGEIERVAGEAAAAVRHYEAARQLFEQVAFREGLAFYHRGLGDLAQARGDYATAWQEFQLSLEISREVHHEWATAYARCGLGRAAVGLGQPATAREQFVSGLWDSRDPGLTSVAIAGLAALLSTTGDREEAVELSSFVVEHPATWNETRRQAQSVLESAARQLPAERVEAATARGKAATLQVIIGRWLGP